MKAPSVDFQTSKTEKITPKFLRPFVVEKVAPADFPRPPHVDQLVEQDIKAEIDVLNEHYRPLGRRANGKEIYEIKQQVRTKHNRTLFEGGLKLVLWNRSEQILNLLRSRGMCPPVDPKLYAQRRLQFIQHLPADRFQELNSKSSLYLGTPNLEQEDDFLATYTRVSDCTAPVSPNQYFVEIVPELVRDYGYPFYTHVFAGVVKKDGSSEKLAGINTDFFAAYIGGEHRMGHDIVFYGPENRFYFYDLVQEQYFPTTEDKVKLGLSLTLQQRAWGLESSQATMILEQFRSNRIFDEIVGKAKALLAVERGFFEGPQASSRFIQKDNKTDTIAATVRAFIESQVAVDEEAVLTISECIGAFECYQHAQGSSIPSVKEIKVIVQAKMREVHGKGMRNDLLLEGNRCVAGWKGLRLEKAVVNP